MADVDEALFESERARAALEKYAAVTRVTVRVYGADHRPLCEPVHPTPLFRLLARDGGDPAIFAECRRLRPGETDSCAVVDDYGLAAVGTEFRLGGEVICTAVAGPLLIAHVTHRETEQIARRNGVSYSDVWAVARKELPVPRQRLDLYGELLRVVGETLLGESRRSRQLEEALVRLEAADRAKDVFLATLSHELRTPLTAIVGWGRILRAGILDSAASTRALDVIDRNTKLQVRIIEDLLDVSRAITGKLMLDVRPVPLAPLIEAALDAARPAATAKGVSLEAVLDRSVGEVRGDPDRLDQIVSNLLSNAVKFTPAGGRVETRLRSVGAHAEVTVSDTGKGITREFLPQLFERFRQADASITKSHGGLGLGLALVRHLTELHGGTIRAESAGKDQGATFTVTLPLADATLRPDQTSLPSPGSADLTGLRILLVEDDADTRELVTMILLERGADVTAVSSAADALKSLDQLRADVIVSDIGLPGTDGYDLIRTIRMQRGDRTPAAALTAYAGANDRERARAAGYQAHLGKPLEPTEFVRVIGRLAGRFSAPG